MNKVIKLGLREIVDLLVQPTIHFFKKVISLSLIASLLMGDVACCMHSGLLSEEGEGALQAKGPSLTKQGPAHLEGGVGGDQAPYVLLASGGPEDPKDQGEPSLSGPSEVIVALDSAALLQGGHRTFPLKDVALGEASNSLVQPLLEGDQEFLQGLAIFLDPEEASAFATLQQIEAKFPLFRWVYINHLAEKILGFLFLRQSDVAGTAPTEWCKAPLWVKGEGLPLKTGFTKGRAIAGFRQGFEFALIRPIHLLTQFFFWYIIIATLIGDIFGHYPFARQMDTPLPTSLPRLFRFIQNADVNTDFVVGSIWESPGFFYFLLSAPSVWGGVKAFFFSCKTSPAEFQNALTALETFNSPSDTTCSTLWKNSLRWILPLHYIDPVVNHVTIRLLWNGNLTLEQRQGGLQALITFTQNATGYAKIVGLHALQKLAAGASLSQLSLLDEKDRAALIKQKCCALITIKEHNPGLKKAWEKGKINGLMHNAYAYYLRWTLGDVDTATSCAYFAFKLAKLFLLGYFFYSLYKDIVYVQQSNS